MKTPFILFLFLITFHFGYCQSISVISSTGFSDNRLFERPISIGLSYTQPIKKINIGGEFLYTNYKASTEKEFVYDMINMMNVICDITIKTKIYFFNAYLSFCLRNNENIAIFLGPKVGLLTFNGIERKYFYEYQGNSARLFEYKLDNKIKYNIGMHFQTEIKKVIINNMSIILDFNPKWIYIHKSVDFGGSDIGPSSLFMTTFGIGLRYNFNNKHRLVTPPTITTSRYGQLDKFNIK